MPRSRPASNPLSFHKPTGQYYVTRGGKRIYLGANQEEALNEYHRLALGLTRTMPNEPCIQVSMRLTFRPGSMMRNSAWSSVRPRYGYEVGLWSPAGAAAASAVLGHAARAATFSNSRLRNIDCDSFIWCSSMAGF